MPSEPVVQMAARAALRSRACLHAARHRDGHPRASAARTTAMFAGGRVARRLRHHGLDSAPSSGAASACASAPSSAELTMRPRPCSRAMPRPSTGSTQRPGAAARRRRDRVPNSPRSAVRVGAGQQPGSSRWHRSTGWRRRARCRSARTGLLVHAQERTHWRTAARAAVAGEALHLVVPCAKNAAREQVVCFRLRALPSNGPCTMTRCMPCLQLIAGLSACGEGNQRACWRRRMNCENRRHSRLKCPRPHISR